MARGLSAYTRFAAALRKQGVSMKEVGRRWQASKSGRGSSAARAGGGGGGGGGMHKRFGGGFVGVLGGGAMTALWVTGGKALSRIVPHFLKMEGTDTTKAAMIAGIQLATGAGVAWAADRFLGAGPAELLFAGAVQGVVESTVRKLEVPLVAPLLGDEGDAMMGYTYELSEFPRGINPAMAMAAGLGPMGAYPLSGYVQS